MTLRNGAACGSLPEFLFSFYFCLFNICYFPPTNYWILGVVSSQYWINFIYIYIYMCVCVEGNVLFNDTLNTFYLWLYYGVRHGKIPDSERGNPLPPHGLLFPINSKGFFYMHHPKDRITHTTAFVTPAVEHWLEQEIDQWVHPMKYRSDDPSHHQWRLLPRSYTSFLYIYRGRT